jgi:hypothetical protein
VLYDEPLRLDSLRQDLIFYSVPYDKLVATSALRAKLRKLVKNMIYVGFWPNCLKSTWVRLRRPCVSNLRRR